MRHTRTPDTGETVFTPTFQRLRDSYFSNLLAEEKILEQELNFDDLDSSPKQEEKKKRKSGRMEEKPSPHGILSKVFFFFRRKMFSIPEKKSDDKNKEEVVLFFHSPVELHEFIKVRLIGQIQALLEETNKYHPRDERVIVIHFQNVQLGMGYINSEIVFVIGFHRTIPMTLIRDQMHRIIEGMILLHGPQIQDIRPCDGMEIKDLTELLGREFVPLVRHLQSNVLSMFHPIIYFPLPYKHNSIFLKGSQLLERFHRINTIKFSDEQDERTEEVYEDQYDSSSRENTGYLGGSIILGGEQILSRTIPEEVLQWMLVRVQNIGSEREDLIEWKQEDNNHNNNEEEQEEEEEGEDVEEETEQQKVDDEEEKGVSTTKEDEIDEESDDDDKMTNSLSNNTLDEDFDDLPPLEKLPTPPPQDENEVQKKQKDLLNPPQESSVRKKREDVKYIAGGYCSSIHSMTPFVQVNDPVFDDPSKNGSNRNDENKSVEWKMQNSFPKMRIYHNKTFEGFEDFLPPTVLVEFGNIRIHYSFAHVSRDSMEGMKREYQGSGGGGDSVRNKKKKEFGEKKLEDVLRKNGFPKCLFRGEDEFSKSIGGSYVFCVIIQIDTIVLLRLYDMLKLTQFTQEKKKKNEEEFSFALQKLFGLKCQIESVLRESDFSDFQFIQHQGMKVKNVTGGGGKPRFGINFGDPMQFLTPEKEKAKSLVQNIVHQRTRSGSGVQVQPKSNKRECVMVFDTVSKILEGDFTEQKKKSFLPKLCMIHNHFENSGIHKIVLKNSKQVIYGKKVFDHEVYYVKESKKNEEESLTNIEKKVKEKLREDFKINIM